MELIGSETVRITQRNQKVITFVKETEASLCPQTIMVYEEIRQHSPIFRHQLVTNLAGKIITKRTISRVVSYEIGLLKKLGVITIESFDDWTKKQEQTVEAQPEPIPNTVPEFISKRSVKSIEELRKMRKALRPPIKSLTWL